MLSEIIESLLAHLLEKIAGKRIWVWVLLLLLVVGIVGYAYFSV